MQSIDGSGIDDLRTASGPCDAHHTAVTADVYVRCISSQGAWFFEWNTQLFHES